MRKHIKARDNKNLPRKTTDGSFEVFEGNGKRINRVLRGRIDIEATLRLVVALAQKVYFF